MSAQKNQPKYSLKPADDTFYNKCLKKKNVRIDFGDPYRDMEQLEHNARHVKSVK